MSAMPERILLRCRDVPRLRELEVYRAHGGYEAVRAALTVTLIGAKTGQFLADGPDYCGDLVFTDLGVSRATSGT